ncbi:hypothetical protein [Paraburkholderia azotifigens]|uniref:Uncharacterized protein n=1 Tax=Paraburkholderia azotifigens TaxID=2057004 RepID=A0A5C6VGZ9_9BURK|nr:hypothetical protein [Paraburkholderia azotifigens]TXC84179.1 hypothetical protein FRZ40_28195 [Paraburkholderia azotifigens]
MNRLPTRYGPSQDNRNVMVDYEHPGKTEFIIVNDRAYPVKNEGGQYRTYDSAHPERPSHGVSVDANGQWQISQGLKGGGQDPDQSASGGNNPFGQPAVPPQHPPQPPQPQNFNDFLGMAFGMQNLQHQQQHLQAMQAMQQQGAGGNAGQGAGGGNAGPWGAPGNPAQGGAGGQG